MRAREGIDEDELRQTLAKALSDNAAQREAFERSPSRSIRPEPRKSLRPPPPPPPAGLLLGATIGQGGMGVVRNAKQRVLDRDVAVKTIKPELQSDMATRMLLQEALVLGRLEHPSIVPIYDIQYEAGQPRIVLKKVEGVEWSELMHAPARIKEQLGEDDVLSWNLRTLMQVCNAIHFAHSRGILHRDLKPENIMIGKFGEVYVMDWGLGLALKDDGTGRFALARDAKELAGTPQYLAPEMLGGASVRISERTDVYLLGAVLYEIITGHPPHTGRTMAEVLQQVIISRPPLSADCPEELARICRTAMDPDPGWRYESAEAMRVALNRFLQHAGSYRLEHRAQERCAELLALIGRPAADPAAERERVARAQALFAEARFAFQQALEIWPDNEAARSGLVKATEAMIEHELQQNNAIGAQALLAQVPAPTPGLRERVELAVKQTARSNERLAALESYRKQLDVRTGTRNRAIGAALLGIAWTIAPLFAERTFEIAGGSWLWTTQAFKGVVLVVLGMWSWLRRKDMSESGVTRRLMAAAALTMVVQGVFELASHSLGVPADIMQVLWPSLWFTISAMLVITVDNRLWPMTLGFLAALFWSVLAPEQRFRAMALSNLVMTINMFVVWMPMQRRAASRRSA
jgi:eukaryotic-like serine/threonine-protein kinase